MNDNLLREQKSLCVLCVTLLRAVAIVAAVAASVLCMLSATRVRLYERRVLLVFVLFACCFC